MEATSDAAPTSNKVQQGGGFVDHVFSLNNDNKKYASFHSSITKLASRRSNKGLPEINDIQILNRAILHFSEFPEKPFQNAKSIREEAELKINPSAIKRVSLGLLKSLIFSISVISSSSICILPAESRIITSYPPKDACCIALDVIWSGD